MRTCRQARNKSVTSRVTCPQENYREVHDKSRHDAVMEYGLDADDTCGVCCRESTLRRSQQRMSVPVQRRTVAASSQLVHFALRIHNVSLKHHSISLDHWVLWVSVPGAGVGGGRYGKRSGGRNKDRNVAQFSET